MHHHCLIWLLFSSLIATRFSFMKVFVVVTAKRVMSSAARSLKAKSQVFENVVVVDFEATCDKTGQPVPQEIIEFPAIVLDTKTGQSLSEFHTYVKPKFHPILSTFCTELTGIIQSSVNDSPHFEVVLKEFDRWIQHQSLNSFAFVTCGDWDFGKQLTSQCDYYQISVPPYFQQWINIKKIFANHTGTWPRGMPHMLSLLNLPLIGRHHSGIDDCRNIAAVVKILLQQGAEFMLTSSRMKTK